MLWRWTSIGRVLREKITNDAMPRVISAHNPLSDKLAKEADIDGIWASGFQLSATQALPDVSRAGEGQHLGVGRYMTEWVSLPMAMDIYAGFGKAINIPHAGEQDERAGAATIVIEDKTF